MSGLENISYFAGIKFHKGGRGLMLHQRIYASEILKRFEMEECNATSTPAETGLQPKKDPNEDEVDPTKYRRLIGSLRYLCHTGLALAYSVGMVSRFMQRPNVSHLATIKGILRHLKGTLDYDVLFPTTNKGKKCILVGYIDSSWCCDVKDRKSIDGSNT